jgi:hypothetical protein
VVGSLSEERHDWHSRVKIVLYAQKWVYQPGRMGSFC